VPVQPRVPEQGITVQVVSKRGPRVREAAELEIKVQVAPTRKLQVQEAAERGNRNAVSVRLVAYKHVPGAIPGNSSRIESPEDSAPPNNRAIWI